MQRHLKILVMGRCGAGKTTLARALAPLLGAVHFSADELRKNGYRDMEFPREDPVQPSSPHGAVLRQCYRYGAFRHR
jgi:adenylylsulfate kinase